jgi:hypothetical protein
MAQPFRLGRNSCVTVGMIYLMRVIAKAFTPSFTVNFLPVLSRMLRVVAVARMYFGLVLDVTPLMRSLLPLANPSSLIRSFVFVIKFRSFGCSPCLRQNLIGDS